MQLIKFKSTSCYNTELPEESSIFEGVKITTFSSHIQNHYSRLLPRHITTVTLQKASESAIISTANALTARNVESHKGYYCQHLHLFLHIHSVVISLLTDFRIQQEKN
jgi:hypothetical protein